MARGGTPGEPDPHPSYLFNIDELINRAVEFSHTRGGRLAMMGAGAIVLGAVVMFPIISRSDPAPAKAEPPLTFTLPTTTTTSSTTSTTLPPTTLPPTTTTTATTVPQTTATTLPAPPTAPTTVVAPPPTAPPPTAPPTSPPDTGISVPFP